MLLRYLDCNQDLLNDSLLAEAFSQSTVAIKAKSLARLGIVQLPNEKPLAAWLRHLSEINGVDYTEPCHPDLADAILDDMSARRFMFFLA